MRLLFAFISFFVLSQIQIADAQYRITASGNVTKPETRQATQVRALLEAARQSSSDDLAAFKVAIDQTIDPSIDADQVLRWLDVAVGNIRLMAGPTADEERLLGALRAYVYQAGAWNNQKAFSYDHSDPLGTLITNKLLATYLDKRLGNCVSMPTLVLILGRKLGLDMTLATAPSHLFVKYRPKGSNAWINLETTSGANPARDAWLRQGFPMSDLSIEQGLYMKPLSHDELLASIAVTALEHAYGEKRYWDAILIAEDIMALDPKNLSAVLLHGSSHSALMDEDFHAQFPNPNDVPAEFVPVYKRYAALSQAAFEYAAELGFEPEK